MWFIQKGVVILTDEEFIKFAYEKGGIEDLSKAFKDYPPENEWHKGKVENILNEK